MLSKKNKEVILLLIIIIGLLGLFPWNFNSKEEAIAELTIGKNTKESSSLPIIQQTSLLSLSSPCQKTKTKAKKAIKVIVTAYSSSICETQGDPFITASGNRVRDGIVANNLLPFGTEIKLPAIFGDKVFVVEDRMSSTKGYYHIDVWFPSRKAALDFGAKLTEMEIISKPSQRS